MDPVTFFNLGKQRQEELLAWAARQRPSPPRPGILQRLRSLKRPHIYLTRRQRVTE